MFKSISKFLKRTKRKRLGWVNVYLRVNGKYHISCIPYKTKRQALESKAPHPKNGYLGTYVISYQDEDI